MKNRILLSGGLLLDKSESLLGVKKDILLSNGRIDKIADDIPPEADMQVINLQGNYVVPGFIDIHAHVFPGCDLGVEPDSIGVKTGVTCICDAGTAGPENLKEFIDNYIQPSKTRVFSEMHFSRKGLFIKPEADDPSKYDIDLAEKVYYQYKDYIVAIKARASNSTVGKLGIEPIKEAKKLSSRIGIPLYVHIGNPLPYIEDVLEVMQKGDMVTHCFHGKINGLLQDGKIKAETQKARDRGVLFDVGHGKESFNFNTAKTAFALGFYPDVISTDLHVKNVKGPVYSLPVTMDKMMALGISLEDCVEKVTAAPAAAFSLKDLGKLKEGYLADITVFHVENGHYDYTDSDGNVLSGTTSIRPDYAIVGGVVQMQQ
ncbi:MAG: amidohydrolase/deacetylase family metallohydrolase [Angelakisella sp.]|nr:amidohydrolase/deacetylase family metallohydrolase [Angelakisella sp.]